MKSLTDEIINVMADYLVKYGFTSKSPENLKEIIEQNTKIEFFDGGVFISKGNEFDLFVLPEKQGKWRIRTTVNEYLNKMHQLHDKIIIKVHKENKKSLRLAKHFRFKEIGNEDLLIIFERCK